MIRQNQPFVSRSDDLAPGATAEDAMGEAAPLAMADGVPLATPVEQSEVDEQIYCPICGYNLTGILSGRCPECGSLFNREALIAVQKLHAITLIPWDDPEPMRVRDRFWTTLGICLFQPDRFAHAFSVQPQKSNVATFWWANALLLGLALFVLSGLQMIVWLFTSPTMSENGVEPKLLPVVWILSGTISLIITEILVFLTAFGWAGALTALCPHFDGKRSFRPWFAITCYSSAHFQLIPACILCLVPVFVIGLHPNSTFICGIAMAWVACGLLDLATLWSVVKHRTVRGTASILTYLLLLAWFIAITTTTIIASVLLSGWIWRKIT